MRVLVVTVVHTPLDARIHHRQIRALRAADVEVTYLAPWEATGTPQREAAAGVVPLELPRAVGRRRLDALRSARRAITALAPRHDLILLHDPELVLAVAGHLRDLPPVVLDVHEDLVNSLPDRPWLPKHLRPIAGWGAVRLERWAENHVELLLAEASYRRRFVGEHLVVPNLPWLPGEVEAPGTHDRLVYVGRLSLGRGVRELLAVADAMSREAGPRLHLVGPADDDVRSDVQAAEERGVAVWHGFVPNERALELVRGAVAGLSLLHDLPNYRGSMPTKLLEYLAHGVPAITTPLPEAAQLVEGSGAGIVVPFSDPDAVVAAVRSLTEDAARRERLGANGRGYVAEHANWDAAATTFVEHLRSIARRA